MFGKEFLFHLNNIPEDLIFRRLTEIVSLFSHNDCRKCGRHHVPLYQSGPRSHIRVRRRGSGRNQSVEHNSFWTNAKCLPKRQIYKQKLGSFFETVMCPNWSAFRWLTSGLFWKKTWWAPSIGRSGITRGKIGGTVLAQAMSHKLEGRAKFPRMKEWSCMPTSCWACQGCVRSV